MICVIFYEQEMFFLEMENILVFYKNGLGFTGGTLVISRSSSLSCLLCSLSSSIDVLVSKYYLFLTNFYKNLVKILLLMFCLCGLWLIAESLWLSSALAVLLAIVFVVICSVMAITAILKGQTVSPRMLPKMDDESSFFNLFTAVPVIVTAFTFHFNGKNSTFFSILVSFYVTF